MVLNSELIKFENNLNQKKTMTALEFKNNARVKALKMTESEILKAQESLQQKFVGGGDLEEIMLATDALNEELAKRGLK